LFKQPSVKKLPQGPSQNANTGKKVNGKTPEKKKNTTGKKISVYPKKGLSLTNDESEGQGGTPNRSQRKPKSKGPVAGLQRTQRSRHLEHGTKR